MARECHHAAAWADLALVDRIGRADATDLFSEWPWRHDAVLEVRRCTCGEPLTRVVEARSVEPHAAA